MQCFVGIIRGVMKVKETSNRKKLTIKSSGAAAYILGSTIPPLMVSVVLAPRKKAPPNSQKQAMIKAWARVIEPEPTEVAKALATSLAPIPKASMKAKKIPIPKRKV